MNTSRDMESVNDVEVVSPKNNPAPVRAKRTYAEITKNQQSGDHSDSFVKLMKNTVLHHKIPYWNENETEGDGNCFYNALVDQIQNNPGVYETLSENAKQCSTPSELRAAVITFIESWPPALSTQETLNQWKISLDWNRYLNKHRKDGEYADDLVIHCTATFLGKDIYVTTRQNRDIWRLMNSHAGTAGTPITLANNQSPDRDEDGQLRTGGEHFQSLIPVGKDGKEIEACRSCGQQNIKRLKSHLNNSKKDCSKMYDMDLLAAEGKAKAQKKKQENNAKYYQSNRESLIANQAAYDSLNRQEIRLSKAEHYRQNTPEKLKRQAEYDSQNRSQKRKSQAQYDSLHRPEKRAAVAASRDFTKKNQNTTGRLKDFRQAQRDGLSYTCASCCRLWFKTSIVDVSNPRSKLSPDILEPLKIDKDHKLPSTHLCYTCLRYLKAKKLPPLATKNGLSIEPMPENLQLSELEAVLCSKNIIFAKIHSLPRNWCVGSKAKVVNVPINSDDLRNTLDQIKTFPRQPLEGGLLSVKLKRKLSWKAHHLHRIIDREKVIGATQHFKDLGHPLYHDIEINTNYTPSFHFDQSLPVIEEEMEEEVETNHDEEIKGDDCDKEFVRSFDKNCTLQKDDEGSDDNDDRLEAVKSHQFDQGQNFLMADDHPESRVQTSSSKALHLAPGEGKIPSSLMRDDCWDIGGFPHLHPSGKFGLNHQRDIKISHQKYFLQRLQNINPQFRNNKPYLFAATYFLERNQFEQRINLSCQRGSLENGNFNETKDPMNVFDQIKGTPKFWQKKRREMIAKIAQLGPFQFFFTLSCADKRWAENFVSILNQLGHRVTFEKSGSLNQIHDDPCIVLVDGLPLEEFLNNKYPGSDLHKLVKENIYTITKVFDKRVHNFIKHIVFGKNTPMKARHYQYRIEFQSRGAGHTHGVLWLNLTELDADFPGIKEIFKNIKNNVHFDENQMVTVRAFIDNFISCSLQDETVSHIVKEVQIHNHSNTCRKYGSKCRFGFPKFPSEKTIVAQPLLEDHFPSKSDLDKHLKMLQNVLQKVRNVLEDMEVRKKHDKLFAQHFFPKITINDILIHAEIAKDLRASKKLYYEALGVSKKGKIIVLKRTVQEMWVNNYNPEWILAWNGNMDIQLCLDFFAICTYITDYYTKDETGTMTHLIKAVKECHGKGQKETMRALANEFSTHRQVGESEAYYKLFPELHLTESSVKTVFVAGGFPHKRHTFLRKVKTTKEYDDPEDEDDC